MIDRRQFLQGFALALATSAIPIWDRTPVSGYVRHIATSWQMTHRLGFRVDVLEHPELPLGTCIVEYHGDVPHDLVRSTWDEVRPMGVLGLVQRATI